MDRSVVDVDVADCYRLIFVAWNSLFNVPTQEEQVRCFESVATHLTEDGVFVVEAYVPSFLYGRRSDQQVEVEAAEP